MKVISLAMVAVAAVAWASPMDDCLWAMRACDKNSDGVAQAGELVDLITAGDLTKTTHQSPCYGFDCNNAIATRTGCSTRFLSNATIPVYHLGNDVVDSQYFHGNANLPAAIAASGYNQKAEACTMVFRCYPEDVQRNTEWIFVNNIYSIGFHSGAIRVYCGKMGGNAVNPSKSVHPVTANTWIDIAVVHTLKTIQVGGENVVTGNIHTVCTYPGVGTEAAPYQVSDYNILDYMPNLGGSALLGTESLVTGTASSYSNMKFYVGDISRMMVWNRALSNDELVQVFKLRDCPGADADGNYAIGALNGRADEFGGTAGNVSLDLDTDEWRAYPSTIASGDAWTLSVNIAAEDIRPRNLRFKTVGSGATYSVAFNGGTAQNVTADANGTATAFFPASAMQAGANSIVVTRTDAGEALGFDGLKLEYGSREIARNYTEDTTVSADESYADDTELVIDVASGKTVTYSGVLSGAIAIRKTGAGTLTLANAANTFTGGVTVDGGKVATLEQDATTSPFGSGPVTVNQNLGAKLEINTSLANAFRFTGISTRADPSLHFGAVATLAGAVTADTLYFSTAWADRPDRRDETIATFSGAVTADTIGTAPHGTVKFRGLVSANVVDAYYMDNSANVPAALCVTRGNLGRIGFCVEGNTVGTLMIDQTRVTMWKSNALRYTTIQFTGEHLADGWGLLDLNDSEQKYLVAANAPDAAVTQGGAQIVNSGTSKKDVYFVGNFENDKLNVLFEGPMNLVFTTGKGSREITWAARRQLCSGEMSINHAMRFGNGCELPYVNNIYSSSGMTVHFEDMADGALSGVTDFGSSSSFCYYVRGGLFTPRAVSLKLAGKNSDTGRTSDSLYITDGEIWEVYGLNYGTGTGSDFHTVTASTGTYSADDDPKAVDSLLQGTIKVMWPCTNLTSIVYKGDGTSFNQASDWRDTNGVELVSAPDFSLPQYDAVIPLSAGTLTLPTGTTFFHNLQLTGGGTLSGGADATIELFGTFKVDEDIAAGTDYTLDVPLRIRQNTEIALPTNGTFTSNVGISGVGNLTLEGRAQPGKVVRTEKGKGWDVPQGGVFNLNGSNTFSGKLITRRGTVYLRGVLGAEDDNSSLEHACSTGSDPNYLYGVLVYDGVTVNKSVKYSSVGMGAQVSNNLSCVQLGTGSTNVFNRPYKYAASNYLHLFSDTKTVFNDSYTCDNSQQFITYSGSERAEVVFNGIVNVPSVTKGYLGLDGSAGRGDTVFRLNGANGTVGMYLEVANKTKVYCGADNVLVPTTYYRQWGTARLELGGHRFIVPNLNVDSGAVIAGDEGSCFEVTDTTYVSSKGSRYNVFNGKLEGAASLMMSAAGGTLKYSGSGLSVGSLIAAGGTNEVSATATFNQEGSVAFLNDGVISVPAGKRMMFMSGTLNGEPLAKGLYTTAAPGALAGHLIGGGSIRIGIKSLAIYLR